MEEEERRRERGGTNVGQKVQRKSLFAKSEHFRCIERLRLFSLFGQKLVTICASIDH